MLGSISCLRSAGPRSCWRRRSNTCIPHTKLQFPSRFQSEGPDDDRRQWIVETNVTRLKNLFTSNDQNTLVEHFQTLMEEDSPLDHRCYELGLRAAASIKSQQIFKIHDHLLNHQPEILAKLDHSFLDLIMRFSFIFGQISRGEAILNTLKFDQGGVISHLTQLARIRALGMEVKTFPEAIHSVYDYIRHRDQPIDKDLLPGFLKSLKRMKAEPIVQHWLFEVIALFFIVGQPFSNNDYDCIQNALYHMNTKPDALVSIANFFKWRSRPAKIAPYKRLIAAVASDSHFQIEPDLQTECFNDTNLFDAVFQLETNLKTREEMLTKFSAQHAGKIPDNIRIHLSLAYGNASDHLSIIKLWQDDETYPSAHQMYRKPRHRVLVWSMYHGPTFMEHLLTGMLMHGNWLEADSIFRFFHRHYYLSEYMANLGLVLSTRNNKTGGNTQFERAITYLREMGHFVPSCHRLMLRRSSDELKWADVTDHEVKMIWNNRSVFKDLWNQHSPQEWSRSAPSVPKTFVKSEQTTRNHDSSVERHPS